MKSSKSDFYDTGILIWKLYNYKFLKVSRFKTCSNQIKSFCLAEILLSLRNGTKSKIKFNGMMYMKLKKKINMPVVSVIIHLED